MSFRTVALGVVSAVVCVQAEAGPACGLVGDGAQAGDFALVREGRCVPVVVEAGAGEAVELAAKDLSADLARVTGLPEGGVVKAGAGVAMPDYCIWVGRIGAKGLVDALQRAGRMEVTRLAGVWEAGVTQVVEAPGEGVKGAVVIAGSDVRGAIYGVYDLSEALGVSPWHWWADVPVRRRAAPVVKAGAHARTEPAVQYRGIFINDEDWGLQPWAKALEPEAGGIGPKTYDKVCELLLRLRANTLWPAMHACTPAFNSNPANAVVAARRGIVMGSSHAEPMLRNNVREWTVDPHDYNYVKNAQGVSAYWEERVRSNAAYENIWTLGMRGIHDSGMQGVKGVAEQREVLERIFADQRAMLDRHVPGGAAQAPQMFCAYKEVLEVLRAGLEVPDDVLLMWPDDNFGFVRGLPDAAGLKRQGGHGLYYHISYLGRPLAYLWMSSTPPALIWTEMTRTWRAGVRREWIVNVGDIKAAEPGMEYFLRLAWEADKAGPESAREFLRGWAAREFGEAHAEEIAALMEAHYAFNYARKPEHLQGWMPKETPRVGLFGAAEGAARFEEAGRLGRETERLGALLPAEHADAWFQLVAYPVRAAAAAHRRFLAWETWERAVKTGAIDPEPWSARAHAAHAELAVLTKHYNEAVAGGKWRGVMQEEPADKDWKSMRIAEPRLPGAESVSKSQLQEPATSVADGPEPAPRDDEGWRVLALPSPVQPAGAGGPAWVAVPGLGRTGDALALIPPFWASEPSTLAPVDFPVTVPAGVATGRELEVRVSLLPTQPARAGALRKLAVLLDGKPAGVIDVPAADGGDVWSRAVLSGVRVFRLRVPAVAAGSHTLRFSSCDAGLVVDRVEVR